MDYLISVILPLIKLAVQKAVESGLVDWPALKQQVLDGIDKLLPNSIFGKVEKLIAGTVFDLVAAYFQSPPTHLKDLAPAQLLDYAHNAAVQSYPKVLAEKALGDPAPTS